MSFSTRHIVTASFLTIIAALGSPAHALGVGDVAPPLKVGKWIKGEPVRGFEQGKVYVVEFWATWCPPCVELIPHLTETQKAHPEVVFIGQNVSEPDEAKIQAFVDKMGPKMDYRVAIDDTSGNPSGEMWSSWMVAAKRPGIPNSFVVGKDGKILWIGYPSELDRVLSAVADGTFDVKSEESYQADIAEKISTPGSKEDWNAVIAGIDEMLTRYPQYRFQLLGYKAGVAFAVHKSEEAYAVVDQRAELVGNNAAKLNALVNDLVTNPGYEPRDLDRALKYAERANDISRGSDGATLSTLAKVYDAKGDVAKAIEAQLKAIEVAGPNSPEKEELEKTLGEYQAKRRG